MIAAMCISFFVFLALIVAALVAMVWLQSAQIDYLSSRQRIAAWELSQAQLAIERSRCRRPMIFRGYVYRNHGVHHLGKGRQTFIEWMS